MDVHSIDYSSGNVIFSMNKEDKKLFDAIRSLEESYQKADKSLLKLTTQFRNTCIDALMEVQFPNVEAYLVHPVTIQTDQVGNLYLIAHLNVCPYCIYNGQRIPASQIDSGMISALICYDRRPEAFNRLLGVIGSPAGCKWYFNNELENHMLIWNVGTHTRGLSVDSAYNFYCRAAEFCRVEFVSQVKQAFCIEHSKLICGSGVKRALNKYFDQRVSII
jgi:hypothetical protein